MPVIPEILGVLLCIEPCLNIKAMLDHFLSLSNPPHLNIQVLSSNQLSYITANFSLRAGSFASILQKEPEPPG